jgi:serine/threonine-protein kinase ATR
LKPFWCSIAVNVAKDLQSRPQKAQQLSDMLGMSVNQWLILTQTETVPYLVLSKRTDILARIAIAKGPSASIKDVCTDPRRNLAAILALLLIQQSPDIEETAMGILKDVAPEFRETDLEGLVNAESIGVACEILKACADADIASKNQASQTILLCLGLC